MSVASIGDEDIDWSVFTLDLAFFIYESGTPASMGVDLATLVSLVASEKLTPEIGLEDSWHNLYRATTALRDRKINGKAVFHID